MKLLFKIQKHASDVFEYLSNMEKFESVHPIITKITHIDRNKYLVEEAYEMGSNPYYFSYPIVLDSDYESKSISIKAKIMKFTKVEMKFKILENNDFSLIEETIEIRSILPVKKMMQKKIRKHHTSLFKNIGDS